MEHLQKLTLCYLNKSRSLNIFKGFKSFSAETQHKNAKNIARKSPYVWKLRNTGLNNLLTREDIILIIGKCFEFTDKKLICIKICEIQLK